MRSNRCSLNVDVELNVAEVLGGFDGLFVLPVKLPGSGISHLEDALAFADTSKCEIASAWSTNDVVLFLTYRWLIAILDRDDLDVAVICL